jgi:hypothetical protein
MEMDRRVLVLPVVVNSDPDVFTFLEPQDGTWTGTVEDDRLPDGTVRRDRAIRNDQDGVGSE